QRFDIFSQRLDLLELELILETGHRRLAIHDLRHDLCDCLAGAGKFGAIGLFHAVTLMAPTASRGKKLLDIAAEFFVDLGRDIVCWILGKARGGKQDRGQSSREEDIRTA
ncbi:MAG TPA: hypothetical protein VF523_09900, partial [Burkholderiales bacterium]